MTRLLTIPEFIEKYGPCLDAREYLETQESLEIAWANCQRGDWMLWVLKKVAYQDIRALQHIALEVAESVRHLMQDERSTNALEVIKRFLLGQATKEKLETAADAAADAAYAAAYAAADAADAAYAAYAAADAAYAADAAADAAYAAYAAHSNIVRQQVSWEQIKPYLTIAG